jgi:lipopolysaccharide export system protein LptA
MKKILFTSILFLCFCFASFAETITFSADSMTGQTGDSSNTATVLDGHAYVKTSSMEISAERIELSGDDYNNITAEGYVTGKNLDSKMEFECETMEYNRETKVASLKGNVKLKDPENNVDASAQIIDYNQDTEIAVLQIQVNLTQKNNVCKGAYAVYQKKAQLLDISGNAEVKQDKDVFRAQQITLNLDTQNITLAGNVKGTVNDAGKKSEEKKEPEQPQPEGNQPETQPQESQPETKETKKE